MAEQLGARVRMSDEQPSDLEPARPDVRDEPQSYLPRLPWAWLGGVGLFLTLSIGTCHIRERQETEALRKTVLSAYDAQLEPIATRYQELVAKVRANTASAAARTEPETHVDPRLALDALGASKGLYMRLPAEAAKRPEEVASASLDQPPDAIARCLGLSPASAAELFARGSFLEAKWIQQAHEADGTMRLRVVAEELSQRSKRDLPFVTEALGASWFLLVLERGENRRDAPVDAYLWDLRSDKLLLSSRLKAEGQLVSARIAVGGVKPGHYASGAQTGAAQDCSIAGQLRALTGGGSASFGSKAPAPREAIGPPASPAPAETPAP